MGYLAFMHLVPAQVPRLCSDMDAQLRMEADQSVSSKRCKPDSDNLVIMGCPEIPPKHTLSPCIVGRSPS